jgi:hypothetical protein
MRALIAKVLEYGAKKIKPTTLIEKGKEIGVDIDKLKTGDTKLVKKVLKELGYQPKSGFGSKVLKTGTAAGGGAAGLKAFEKFSGDVKEEMEKSRMAGGGMVKKRAKSKKSRGAGAAIKGTKFKGVF